jgi:hypothetical protein
VCLEEMAQVSESFMKTSRGLLSELLPLANGVRHTPPDFTPYQMKSGYLCCIPYPRNQGLPVLICQPDPIAS